MGRRQARAGRAGHRLSPDVRVWDRGFPAPTSRKGPWENSFFLRGNPKDSIPQFPGLMSCSDGVGRGGSDGRNPRSCCSPTTGVRTHTHTHTLHLHARVEGSEALLSFGRCSRRNSSGAVDLSLGPTRQVGGLFRSVEPSGTTRA